MFRNIGIRLFAISAVILFFLLKDVAAQTVEENVLHIVVDAVNTKESGSVEPLPNPLIVHPNEAVIAQPIADNNKPDDITIRDLTAQEAMAFCAKLSFFTNLAGCVLRLGVLIVLYYSLRLNRLDTQAAQSAVEVAREANQAQNRAWVSVNCKLGKPKPGRTQAGVDGIYFEVTCVAKNHGRSPATVVCSHIGMSLIDEHSET